MSELRYIRPIYQPTDDGRVVVYSGELLLTGNDETIAQASGNLELRFTPRTSFRLTAVGSTHDLWDVVSGEGIKEISLAGGSLEPPASPVQTDEGDHELSFSRAVNHHRDGEIIKAERFILHIIGPLVDEARLPRVETTRGSQKQLSFTLPGWQICLACCAGKEADNNFSFVIEARPDALACTEDDITTLRRRIVPLLNLVAGRDIGVGPTVGLDPQNQVCWVEWGAPIYQPWATASRWCPDELVNSALPALADGLGRLTTEPSLERVLSRAVSHYISASATKSMLDVKIPVACSGLELLSWAFLQHHQWLTAESFGKLPAAANVRLFLQWCGIPIELPAHLSGLTGRRGRLGQPAEGPEMLFGIRNDLVHPPKKLAQFEWPSSQELIEAWKLATWYLELAIVRILGYDGKYRSRVSGSSWWEYEPVPWKSNI